ncbi:MAG: MgtC/SapB family protein [Bacteroidales bacterium]|nr:MgtC/SapB family protein [Bacteroidales bacterium]MBP5517448.1 MgtC/SapB family protein [Bacteroidales bacterium]
MEEFLANLEWEHLLRLLVAGILGTVVGLEREYRAKAAGYRTHFLICLGSATFMLVSQYGFNAVIEKYGGQVNAMRLDPARIAAQVVSGIGFLGAGTIILQKQIVKGLTTAAGLWALAGVGLAIGAGMYFVGIAATIFILIGLEVLRFFFKGLGLRSIGLEILVPEQAQLESIQKILAESRYMVSNYNVSEMPNGYKVDVVVRIHNKNDENELFRRLNEIKNLMLMKLD